MQRSTTFGSRAARRKAEQQLAADRLRDVASLGRPGWVPDGPPPAVDRRSGVQRRGPVRSPDAGNPDVHEAELQEAEPQAHEDDVDNEDDGVAVRDTYRERLLDRLPWTIRSARWSVSPAAVLALLAVAGLLALVVAVRTATAAPGLPVPVRPSQSADEPTAGSSATDRTDASAVEARPSSGVGAGAGATVEPAATVPNGSSPAGGGVVVVHVVGQVGSPGLVRVPAGARVDDALRAAGGATAEADLARVNLARPVVDGEQLFVPRPGEEPPSEATPVAPAPAPGAAGGAPGGGVPGQLVDLNTATSQQLDTLPGIGPVLAQRIVDWRTEHGRFTSVEELAEVSGIGPRLLEGLRPLVRV